MGIQDESGGTDTARDAGSRPFALYLHVPFCAHLCPYCDFATTAEREPPLERYVSGVIAELRQRATSEVWSGREVRTVFLGGGTPSLLAPQQVVDLLRAIRSHVEVRSPLEVTLEANPENVNGGWCSAMREAGVTRVSLGVQSLHDDFLKKLGRNHSAARAHEALATLLQTGFSSVSADLMCALPGGSVAAVERDVTALLDYQLPHISCYELTVEKGTPFFTAKARGALIVPDEDERREQFEAVVTQLTRAGYDWYETSNFARPGHKSLHNRTYWEGGDYLGLGPGAHSAYRRNGNEVVRWGNVASFAAFEERVLRRELPEAWREEVVGASFLTELLLLRLRLREGISRRDVEAVAPQTVVDALFNGVHYRDLEQRGLITVDHESIALGYEGRFLGDAVTLEIVRRLNLT